MSAKSIIQTGDIKQCYISKQWVGDNGEPLEKHHVMNGSLRDWADAEGLWIWVTPQIHAFMHTTKMGVYMLRELKVIAQYAYEREHSHDEWMAKVRKNYVG